MSKPLLTVSYQGTVIGKRRTDRPYTWALVAHSFREAEYRARVATLLVHQTYKVSNAYIAKLHQPVVISYHSTPELAHKAAGTARLDWMCCSISVVPVDSPK